MAWSTATLGVFTSGGVKIDSLGNKNLDITGKEKGLLAFMVVGLWWFGFNIHYMT